MLDPMKPRCFPATAAGRVYSANPLQLAIFRLSKLEVIMDINQYKHLEITVSPQVLRAIKFGLHPAAHNGDIPRFYSLKKWIGSNPLVQQFAKMILAYAAISDSEKRIIKSVERLNSDGGSNAHEFDSPYGYEDDLRELRCALNYVYNHEGFIGRSESKQLYAHIETILTDLFLNEGIKSFFNFGVSYAHIDSILASKFSEIQFVGMDRSVLTKAYNESQFSHLRNLEFIAGDIFQYLDKNSVERGVFFHTRTLLLLPKVFIERLYKAIAKANFQYIVCVEQIGISRQTLQAYQFSEEDQPSVAFRGGMYIHNYPALLRSAGFSVERSELLKTDHPHEDFRLVSFTAKRYQ